VQPLDADAHRLAVRQIAARPEPNHVLYRSQPLGRGANGNSHEARSALLG
jgi:hypothetical protein